MEYHGVQLSNIEVIKFPRLRCRGWNVPCDLVNATVSATKFLSLVKRYDLVYVDTPFVGPFFKRSPPRGNLVFYLHAPIERERPTIPFAKPYRMFMHAYLALGTDYDIIRRARIVLANSKYTAYITEKTLGVKAKVLYPPVDVDLVSKHRSSEREDALVFLARLSRAKGPEQAIRVTKELVKRGLKVKTYIMGSVGDQVGVAYVRSLMKLASDLGINHNVAFVLNPSIKEAYSALGRSKVFLHLREREPFGIVVVEAMAAGAVPVVPRSGAPWHDIIEYGKYGVAYSSEDELVKSVEYLLNGGYEEYAAKAMSRAWAFSADEFIRGLCEAVTHE